VIIFEENDEIFIRRIRRFRKYYNHFSHLQTSENQSQSDEKENDEAISDMQKCIRAKISEYTSDMLMFLDENAANEQIMNRRYE
jgi:hypothetical protein